jgi:hypothetical protein
MWLTILAYCIATSLLSCLIRQNKSLCKVYGLTPHSRGVKLKESQHTLRGVLVYICCFLLSETILTPNAQAWFMKIYPPLFEQKVIQVQVQFPTLQMVMQVN